MRYACKHANKEYVMPALMRDGPLRVFFYSNEGNPREPPHVHVIDGRDEAKFWLTPEVSMAYNDGLKARTLARALRLVEQHRNRFEEAWHEYFT